MILSEKTLYFLTQVNQVINSKNSISRRFHIGKLEMTLKHVRPRKLACTGTKAGLAITALWYLGKNNVKPKTIETIKKQLTKKEYESFKNSMGNMPGWLNDIIRRYEQIANYQVDLAVSKLKRCL